MKISKLENKMGSVKCWVATMNNPISKQVKDLANKIGKKEASKFIVPIKS